MNPDGPPGDVYGQEQSGDQHRGTGSSIEHECETDQEQRGRQGGQNGFELRGADVVRNAGLRQRFAFQHLSLGVQGELPGQSVALFGIDTRPDAVRGQHLVGLLGLLGLVGADRCPRVELRRHLQGVRLCVEVGGEALQCLFVEVGGQRSDGGAGGLAGKV
jgi:hypothetical protein